MRPLNESTSNLIPALTAGAADSVGPAKGPRGERRFRALVEHAADGIVIIDAEARVEYANAAAGRLLGCEPAALHTMQAVELIHPDDRVAATRALAESVSRPGEVVQLRARTRRKDGGYRIIDSVLMNLRDDRDVRGVIATFRDITDHEHALQSVREMEDRYRQIIELSTDAHFIVLNERVVYANRAAARLYGAVDVEELIGLAAFELAAPAFRDEVRERLFTVQEQQIATPRVELRHVRLDGVPIDVEITSAPFLYRGQKAVQAIVRDISERRATARKLARTTHIYAALSETNAAILHTASPDELFREVCRIAVEHGGFMLACIRLVDRESGWIEPVAYSGSPVEYVHSFRLSVHEDIPEGQAIPSQVIRTGAYSVTNDFHGIPPDTAWRAPAQLAGFRAAATFPLRRGGAVCGALSLFAGEKDYFDEALVQLLVEMADNVSYALDNIDRERGRRAAEAALQESEERFRSLTDLSSDWYWEQDTEFRFTRFRGKHVALHRSAFDRYYGLRPWETDFDVEGGWQAYRAQLEARQPFHDMVVRRTATVGERRYTCISGEPVFDRDGAFIGYRGVGRDITKRKQDEELLHLEHTVTRCLADAETIVAGLQTVIRAICETQDWDGGEYWRWDEPASLLRFCESWCAVNSPDARLFERSREATFAPGQGLVGRVWQSREPLWLAQVGDEPRLVPHGNGRATDQRAAFVFPVSAESQTMGVLAIYGRVIPEPSERVLQAMRVIGSQIGQFLRRKHAEEVLRDSEARFRSLTELSSDWYWEQDERFRFVRTAIRNPQSSGHDPDYSLGKTRWELPGVRALSESWEQHRATLKAHLPFRDFEYMRIERGRARYTSVTGVPIFDQNGEFRGYRGVAKDITARKIAEERLTQLAQFDPLTGLPNRGLLRDRLQQTIAQASRKQWQVGVLFLDLDRFKLVNDTLGHQTGDVLLAQVAARLAACSRPGDTVGRMSGDEFGMVLADLANADDAALVAQRMIEALAAPFDLNGDEAFVGASIGIAVYPGDSIDPDVLLKNADAAMYRAKESGRNGYCFYTAEMNQRSAVRLALNNDLRRAIARSEFEVHYQPKVCLRDGSTCGMEALLRWRHPERGMVMPNEFIPALEETGLIVPAGEWVVRAVCEQIKAWRASGLAAVPVAVNLSVRQFQQKDLDARIRAIVDAAGIGPDMIELEITESDLMRDPEHAIRVMRNMRDAGIGISVDDFGTGYSSLAYLRQLPISSLKIDRSFVRNLDSDENDAAIVRAIIDLAHNLKFTVIAEGVETEAQAAHLRRYGCELAQGYLYSRPVPAAEIAARLPRADADACAA